MRGTHRRLLLAASGLGALAIVAACVGDDPSSPSVAPDGGPPADGTTSDTGGDPADGGSEDTGSVVDTGVDAAKRYCETLAKPAAPTEFFCADFDGTDLSEGWTNTLVVDGGIFELTKNVAFSLPQGLAVQPPNATGNDTGPALQWKSVGAQNFAEAELRARVNPSNTGGLQTYTGHIKLLEIKTSNALAAFYYTKGGDLSTSPTMTNDYTGYFVRLSAFGGAAAQTDFVIATDLTETTWTDVKLTFFKNGRATLTYNGISIFDKTLYGSTDTTVTYTLGTAAKGPVNESRVWRYDNVELKLLREQ